MLFELTNPEIAILMMSLFLFAVKNTDSLKFFHLRDL